MQLEGNTHQYYTPDLGVVPHGESVHCGVCCDKMDETRNAFGPRGFAAAMSKNWTHHDVFCCPNKNKSWHKKVVSLRNEIASTSSSKIKEMLESEVQELLSTRQEIQKVLK